MSRIEELKKQNPSFNVNYIDIINSILPKSAYTEMAVNLLKNNNLIRKNNQERRDLIGELVNEYKIDEKMLESMSFIEVNNIFRTVVDYFGYDNFKIIQKFAELNERKLIKNNDLTSYKKFNELELQISLSSLNVIDKELEKQILRLYETEEWLVMKPLSYLSSLKYGASTKWCTASDNNPDYFYKYVKRGVLIYVINKKTGNKVAAYKTTDVGEHDKETSFWNITDQRIDSMESGLSYEVMDIIRDEFTNNLISNWDILDDKERNRQILWLENEYYDTKRGRFSVLRDSDEVAQPMNIRIDVVPEGGAGGFAVSDVNQTLQFQPPNF
jgi:hypothetical protein